MTLQIKNITNRIIELEKQNNLLDWDINGVKVWQLIRYIIYQKIITNETSHDITPILKKKGIHDLYNKLKRFVYAILNNPFLDFKKVDVIIFESSRKIKIEGRYIDAFTKFTYDELKEAGFRIVRYQSTYIYDRFAIDRKDTKHLDLLHYLTNYLIKFKKFHLTINEEEAIINIERKFIDIFGLSFNLVQLIKTESKRFLIESALFKYLFRIKHPEQIFLVNFCDKASIINEAKKMLIEVIDIQHGVMSEHDLIYHYPNTVDDTVSYFPNKFYTWHEIGLNTSKLPISKNNIIEFGNKYLLYQVNKNKEIKKIKGQILITSQDILTKDILHYLNVHYKYFNEYKLLFKPHPKEYTYIYSLPEIKNLLTNSNFEVVPINSDLYQLLAESEFLMAVYTAAIIEALSFKCKIILLNLPGIEMMQSLIDNGKAFILNMDEHPDKILEN